MKWIITNDRLNDDLNDEFNRVGKGNVKSIAEIPQPHVRFRLKDDDGEVYYEGVCNKEEFDNADGERAFAPLDYGMADAGCTTMEYKYAGTGNPWTIL